MNERIKKLALQAKLELEKDIKDGKKDWKNTPQSYDEMVQEKFAELIVQECVGIADEYDGVGSTIVSKIQQHFGV